MRSVIIMFGAILYIICLPIAFHGLHDARVDQFTQNYVLVNTPLGVTAANVTLSKALWGDDITSVYSVTSNISNDTPSTSNYTAANRRLEVSGLYPSSDRTLSVVYEIASVALAELPSISGLIIVIALFVVVAVIGLIAGAIYQYFR